MIIRPLLATDAEAYRALRLFALAESPASFGASHEEVIQVPLEKIREQLERAPEEGYILGAFEHKALVGLGCLTRCEGEKEKHKAWIWGIFVHPDLRRRGIGRAMLENLLEKAHAMDDLLYVKLTLEASNLPARALYFEYGFMRFGTEPLAINLDGSFYDEDYMFLWLGKDASAPKSGKSGGV